MKKSEILEHLKKLIEDETEIGISDNDQKLDIDSFMMLMIISYVNDNMGVEIDMENLDFDVFTSLNTLSDLIEGLIVGSPED
jgi:acyl carrier protein